MLEDGNLAGDMDHERPIFLPAGETSRIWLTYSESYPGEPLKASATRDQKRTYVDKVERWFTKEWSSIHGFVLFDSANRYKVRMVGGWAKRKESDSD